MQHAARYSAPPVDRISGLAVQGVLRPPFPWYSVYCGMGATAAAAFLGATMTRRLLVACCSFTLVAATALLIPIPVDAQRETRERSIPVSVVSGSDDVPVTGLTPA